MRLRTTLTGSMLIAAAATCGCGRAKAPTYASGGTVQYPDGTPLSTGFVTFRSVGGDRAIMSRGPIQRDGTFQLTTFAPGDGAVAGEHQAIIAIMMTEDERARTPSQAFPVDMKFTRYDSSDLTFTVTSDPTQNQFAIQVRRPTQ